MKMPIEALNTSSKRPLSSSCSFSMKLFLLMLLLGGATRSLALSLSANGNEFGHSTSPTAAAYGKRLKPSKTRVSTQRLHYRNEGSDEEHQKQQRWTMSTPLVTSGVVSAKGRKFLVRASPSSTAEDDQDTQKVDEYLEFLDKRYNRVHQIDLRDWLNALASQLTSGDGSRTRRSSLPTPIWRMRRTAWPSAWAAAPPRWPSSSRGRAASTSTWAPAWR